LHDNKFIKISISLCNIVIIFYTHT
jgi:hypothetical protein